MTVSIYNKFLYQLIISFYENLLSSALNFHLASIPNNSLFSKLNFQFLLAVVTDFIFPALSKTTEFELILPWYLF